MLDGAFGNSKPHCDLGARQIFEPRENEDGSHALRHLVEGGKYAIELLAARELALGRKLARDLELLDKSCDRIVPPDLVPPEKVARDVPGRYEQITLEAPDTVERLSREPVENFLSEVLGVASLEAAALEIAKKHCMISPRQLLDAVRARIS